MNTYQVKVLPVDRTLTVPAGASLLQALQAAQLTREVAASAGIAPEEITLAAIVGNTAMHHLLLNIDPKPLTTPPYMPAVTDATVLSAEGFLPIAKDGVLRILPNIAGFVGADTVGCLVAALLETEDITGTGRIPCKQYRLGDTPVILTQQDVRKVQLAKSAIRAGIELMCAVSRSEFEYSKHLCTKAEFLELASRPHFQDRFVDCLIFEVDEDD